MTEVTFRDLTDALRNEMRADMRVHRNRMNTVLREFKTEVGGKIDEHTESQQRVEAQMTELVTAVTQLVEKDRVETAARERRVTVVRRTWRVVTSAPGALASVTAFAGVIAGAIAFL